MTLRAALDAIDALMKEEGTDAGMEVARMPTWWLMGVLLSAVGIAVGGILAALGV